MEEETTKKEPFIKNLIINILYMFLFLFLFMWIYPAPKVDLSDVKVNLDNTTLKPLLNDIFADNIEAMRISAKDYYTIDRLPKNNGDKSSMTLENMLNRKLLVPFVDEDGNSCDTNNSYVEVTKNSNDYSLKVNLVCNRKSDYIVDTIGCTSTCTTTNKSNINTNKNNQVAYLKTGSLSTTNKSNDNYKYIETVKVVEKEVNKSLEDTNVVVDYSKKPIWNNNSNRSCYVRESSCNSLPSAVDPYSGKALSVKIYNGNININVAGTYVVTYETYTEHGIYDSTTYTVTVKNNSSTTNRKYISNYRNSYYNDGVYSGYLTLDSNNGTRSNYISDYYWSNRVRYTYKCTIAGGVGVEGWSHISTDTSDNHPTIYYSNNGYSGTLYKKNFYCKEGCSDKLAYELGTCYNVGQTKIIYRTWMGIYAGYVYSNIQNTYSGYVYLIK